MPGKRNHTRKEGKIMQRRIVGCILAVFFTALCAGENPATQTCPADVDDSWWQASGQIGYHWYVGSGWRERSGKLFTAAGEVAEAIDKE